MRPKYSGAIVYDGPSLLDGSPIVCIVTGLADGGKSDNPKTGNMYQAWILRSDMNPAKAVEYGFDSGICGNCKFRPIATISFGVVKRKNRRCYVNLRAPGSVYRAYKRGSYPVLTPEQCGELMSGGALREGAYGDPAAVPIEVWQALTRATRVHTGYTHQWPEARAQVYRPFLMASVDSPEEYARAVELGWRTFRVTPKGAPKLDREITCPASAEAGYKSQCAKCSLCAGADKVAKNIAIENHGSGSGAFIRLESLRGISARSVGHA